MRIASRIPYELSRTIVPRLPRYLQRFSSAKSWEAAQQDSTGYAPAQKRTVPLGSPTASMVPLSGNSLATIAAFGAALDAIPATDPVTVVDFGGFDGSYADLVRDSFPARKFEWTVVELPDVVSVMTSQKRSDLSFTADLSLATKSGCDILFASASLNYVATPTETLRSFLEVSRATILTRLPLWPISDHQVAIQRAKRWPHKISYPTWFFSETQLMDQARTHAQVALDFVCPDDRGAFDGHYSTYRGLALIRMRSDIETIR